MERVASVIQTVAPSGRDAARDEQGVQGEVPELGGTIQASLHSHVG